MNEKREQEISLEVQEALIKEGVIQPECDCEDCLTAFTTRLSEVLREKVEKQTNPETGEEVFPWMDRKGNSVESDGTVR